MAPPENPEGHPAVNNDEQAGDDQIVEAPPILYDEATLWDIEQSKIIKRILKEDYN